MGRFSTLLRITLRRVTVLTRVGFEIVFGNVCLFEDRGESTQRHLFVSRDNGSLELTIYDSAHFDMRTSLRDGAKPKSLRALTISR